MEEESVNVIWVDGKRLDETERAIYAAAYVAKLLRPMEGPPMPPMVRDVNGKRVSSSDALTCAAWAVSVFRADQAAR